MDNSQGEEDSKNQSVEAQYPQQSTNNNSNKLYHYQPLDKSVKSSFRLATLLPGAKTSQPHLTLSDSTWENERGSYEALSYVWGDLNPKKTIILNRSSFEVTVNLYSALSHLRFEDRPRHLWVDAICIDQNSIKERNHQVASMAEIYENSQRVLVWLGDENEETEFLAPFIEHNIKDLQANLPEIRNLLSIEGLARLYTYESSAEVFIVTLLPDLEAGWSYFFGILGRQWWARAWIVQEFVTAPDVVFCIGTYSFHWMPIFALILLLNISQRVSLLSYGFLFEDHSAFPENVMDICFQRLAWQIKVHNKNSRHPASQKPSRFLTLLRSQSTKECGDRRDKVYSILSMTDSKVRQILHPDYSKSVPSVYIATVKAYISVFNYLDILGYNTHQTSLDCPSWCPDWSRNNTRRILKAEHYKASGETIAEVDFSEDESTIHIRGFLVSTVTEDVVQDTLSKITNDLEALNWDIQLMVRKFQDRIGGMKDGLRPDYETCAASVAQALVEGTWENSAGHEIECPPMVTDPETGEFWLGDKIKFKSLAKQTAYGKTLIFCNDGRVGLAPKETKDGDEIWVFLGATTPFVIRRIDEGPYKLIGSCYVHGIMRGELMEELGKGRYELSQVALR